MLKTRIIEVDYFSINQKYIRMAATFIARGKLVIVPTETVYGIACNMTDRRAIKRLEEIKNRPSDKPFSLHIDIIEKVDDFAADIPAYASRLMYRFWPGPLTMVFKGKQTAKIGIRLPDDVISRMIIAKAQVPVVCPSANLSGKPAPVNFSQAIKDLDGLVDLAIDAGPCRIGIESTVVDATAQKPLVLREGAIKKDKIDEVANKKTILFVCTGNSCRSVMAQALLQKRLKEKGRSDIEVLSAGIMQLQGIGATEATRQVLQKEDIDVSKHISQRINRQLLHCSDIILVMERLHEEKILSLAPEVKNRVFLLKEFAKMNNNDLDIADPIGKPISFYEKTLQIIKEAVEVVAELI